ncbi:hypothetical protein KUTeg_020865 [Tegillarca granosa]|uniref:Saposin B-type domain-containing protein n=1 Tax=Tegillarca granosa TaxID=220873 RepID=A0ABQ9E966_TEGGR|nr:hypothetical protein KUTeg_020865 [Tegillarca granosa]
MTDIFLNMYMLSVVLLTMVLTICFASEHNADELQLPKGIPRELYCTGCELTIKVMNKELSYHTGGDMSQRIRNVMKQTCDKKSFDIHEASVDKLLVICKHLLKNYGAAMHPVLYKYYNGKSRAAEMECDQTDEDIMKHFGKAAKKVDPVHESVVRDGLKLHEEL